MGDRKMERLIKVFFSPMIFAVGLLWPLGTQILIASGLMTPGWPTWAVSAAVVLPFALMAQIRGSWLWVK